MSKEVTKKSNKLEGKDLINIGIVMYFQRTEMGSQLGQKSFYCWIQ